MTSFSTNFEKYAEKEYGVISATKKLEYIEVLSNVEQIELVSIAEKYNKQLEEYNSLNNLYFLVFCLKDKELIEIPQLELDTE